MNTRYNDNNNNKWRNNWTTSRLRIASSNQRLRKIGSTTTKKHSTKGRSEDIGRCRRATKINKYKSENNLIIIIIQYPHRHYISSRNWFRLFIHSLVFLELWICDQFIYELIYNSLSLVCKYKDFLFIKIFMRKKNGGIPCAFSSLCWLAVNVWWR